MRKVKYIYLVIFFLLFSTCIPCNAYGSEKHDDYLELALFGKKDPFTGDEDKTNKLLALEYASYLAVDQFGKENSGHALNDKYKLEFLSKTMKINGLPDEVSSFWFTPPSGNHRDFTHMGWNYDYSSTSFGDVSKWREFRKPLLVKTVNRVLDFGVFSVDFLFLNVDSRADDFAAIIYYIHVLGDHISDTFESKKVVKEIDFAGHDYGDTNDILQQLLFHFNRLFSESTKDSGDYDSLKRDLERINSAVRKIRRKYQGLDIPEAFDEAHPYAEKAMKSIEDHLPDLLKQESFFYKSFYE